MVWGHWCSDVASPMHLLSASWLILRCGFAMLMASWVLMNEGKVNQRKVGLWSACEVLNFYEAAVHVLGEHTLKGMHMTRP